ncbi:integrin alpha-3-like isoform X3 [Hippoglossus hippoglossus]|uniref:integrin alpha-3-like isoform X3 n=1 Tax=Hippoglossus hippoglossus TaxID=8267 RepID=UPI00148BBDAC|nr:integrin alpha-3-like isoform X3 [Hippoglossus hippoglossus]
MLLSSSQVCVSMALGDYAFLAVYISVCVTFNLDTSFPLLKTGGDGSLFGLSVALHQDLKTDTYLLLVGAPREKAEPDVLANRTGGVYSCPISMDQSDCSRMKLIHPDVNPSEDLIEDMWLGVSVASQVRPGGRVLACGHRFVKLYGPLEVRQMIGRCYLLGNDLQFNESDMNWQKPDQPCSHLGDVRAEVMCNAGISASITQTEVIVGSPGSYEWQGYSVAQARCLLSEDDVTIVTGAPKDSKDDARGSVLLVVKQNNELVVQQTLRGEQTGSYFGNAVATTDLNNDGWNDLLVGAPFYFHREQEAGGAVYVYMNSGGGFNSGPSVVLRGPAQSAFGMTVAAAGDLNQDGFQDFAVGAPFSETGSVMIWTGSSEGVSTEPSQVIRGSSVAPRFRTFGFSLSAGVDVDGNKYPDLVVGSLDDTVALLRTRPVIHLNKTLRISPDIVDPDICDFCIEVEVCFSYIFSTGEKNDRDNITVHFAVAADVTSLKPRLRFHENRQSTYSGYLTMPKTRCDSLRVGLLSPIRDKLQPLVFSLNVSLYEKPPKKRSVFQDLKLLPVLSHTPQPIRTQIHIQKACGSDNRCHSNLQMTAQFTDENQKPLSMKKNKQVLNYNSGINRLFLEVNVSNTPSQGRQAEDAHNAILNISIPPSLIYSGIRTKAVKADVTAAECSVHHTVLQCELGNPFKSNHKVQLFIIFQTSDISLETTEIQTLLQLSTLSEQHLSPVSVSMLVEYSLQTSLTLISSPGPASFSGHVIGESATKKTEDVGSLLLFTFQVHVNGKPLGHQGNLEVEFNWPSVLSNGKWLLYLTEIRVHGTSEPRCNPPDDIINPLNLVLPMEKRKGRGLEEEMRGRGLEEEAEEKRGRGQEEEKKKSDKSPPILHLHQQKRKSYTLDCVHGAKCVTFVCPLINMKNSATLSVRARIWNSTMIEDYSDARSVLVRGRATLKLRTNKHTINIGSQSTEIEVHIYPDLGQQVDSSAPLLIIGVSMVAGVLLLALICLVLWKCGFFRRASTRELYEAKSQTAHVKRPESEHERLSKEL